jgi:hypothetical protein
MCLDSVIGNRWKKKIGDINTWRGFIIPDRNFNAFIAPIYDPKFVYTRKNEKLAEKIWIKDIANILQKIDKKLPVLKQTEKCIQYINSDEEFDTFLPIIEKSNTIAFDFETTSLKPYYSKQKIVCTSIAVSDTKVFVFMNTPYRNKKFINILKKRKILKIAHNLQMEDKWCNIKLKTKVKGWLACTMNNTHILDNRSDITSLKFQVYINFGIADYDSLIFGCPVLIRNLTVSRRKKTYSGYVEVKPEKIVLEDLLKELEINHEQLICIAILIGTDYNPKGVIRIGQKKALQIVKEFQTPEAIFESVKEKIDEMEEEDRFDWKVIYELLKSPKVDDFEIKYVRQYRVYGADGNITFYR